MRLECTLTLLACLLFACGSKTVVVEAAAGSGGALGGEAGSNGGATSGGRTSAGFSGDGTVLAECQSGETRACVGPAACKGGQACGKDQRWDVCDCGGHGGAAGGIGNSSEGGAVGSIGEGGSGEGGEPDESIPAPSCAGLPKTCGVNQDGDCCASSVIRGGMFYRIYDGVDFTSKKYPATISEFRLDRYEITVNRFNNFVAAYSQNMIPKGAGKNPNNPDDPGWDPSWNQYLAPDSTALVAALKCQHYTYRVPSSSSNFPINCLSWFEAQAFCIWDGGRLPTEAEWNYAAAGGAEQRQYPWGSTSPDHQHSVYNVAAVAEVGSVPAGDGKWGQSDMSGNLQEWVQDTFRDPASPVPLPLPCVNCTDSTDPMTKVVRDRSYLATTAARSSDRQFMDSIYTRSQETGARCARPR